MPDFDLAIIGAGAAGLSVAAGAAQLGARVALIERNRMGGDCLNTGCVPSKALLAAAHAMRSIRRAARFGIVGTEAVADWDAVRAHVQDVIASIAPVNSEARFRALGATVLLGEARFIDPATISVDGRPLTARRFVIAAGSRAAVPSIDGLGGLPFWTNESLFDLTQQPDHLVILGGGPIGLEMADAFSGLGCHVTVVEAGRIAAREDPELTAGLRQALTAGEVTIRENAAIARIEPGLVVVLADGARIAGSHLLVAAGRTPNLAALDLAAGNIQAGPAGIATDRGLRSLTNKRVFAVGDIADPAGVGPRAFTHVGSYHAGIVIRRLLFRLPARIDYAALPRVTYTDPELAQTGLTEAEAVAAGLKPRILRWPLADNDRAVAERDTAGLVKLIVNRNRVVGAGILAPHAGEMISQWSLAIAQRTRLSTLAGLIVPFSDPLGGRQARRGQRVRSQPVLAPDEAAGKPAFAVALTIGCAQFAAMTFAAMSGTKSNRVALALQGGGSHGAFTWGVVDRLLEDGQRIDSICGVSSGAMIGVMVTQGLARGGPDAARADMRRLWQRVANAHALSPLQAAPMERWLFGGWDLSNSMLWQGVEMAMRMFGPAQMNPFAHTPMQVLLEDLIDPRLLAHPSAPRLTVAATDVSTGRATFFGNSEIGVDVLCASACLPFVFPAVEIKGRAYWDGGYSGNPPLAPLLEPELPDELILVRAQAAHRPGVPTTPTEITNRLNEIACQNVLTAELAALPRSVTLRIYDADEALLHLPISSKVNGEEAFLKELFEAGRSAVDR